MSTEQNFPPGWDEQRVRRVLEHYDRQSEDEQLVEIEAALEGDSTTLVAVPSELLPEVRALLARKRPA